MPSIPQGSQMSIPQSHQGKMQMQTRDIPASRPTKYIRRHPTGSIDQDDEDYPVQKYERQPQQLKPTQQPQQYFQQPPIPRQSYARPPAEMAQYPPQQRFQYAPPMQQQPYHQRQRHPYQQSYQQQPYQQQQPQQMQQQPHQPYSMSEAKMI